MGAAFTLNRIKSVHVWFKKLYGNQADFHQVWVSRIIPLFRSLLAGLCSAGSELKAEGGGQADAWSLPLIEWQDAGGVSPLGGCF